MSHFVYMVQCVDGTLYVGYTTDVARRLREHNGVGSAGARYTRSRRPVTLVFYEPHPSQVAAQRREAALKQLPRSVKLDLIREQGFR